MFSRVEIVSTGSHVAANLLYFRQGSRRTVIKKEQASGTGRVVHLLKPLLRLLQHLGRRIGPLGGVYYPNHTVAEGARLQEGEVNRLHCAYFHIALLFEPRPQPLVKL